ncbi:hypothetical protein AVEN_268904-1 [Araneus ventricosus]|uniref:Uncharacterized protein n=1 Tax=Araneus ventricosus TaxID=182803 RepID=A0A4Y2PAS3_ARAVE|nr:hypothetical protein AVEN_268904-1 [Araneus ventricosus]
MLCYLNYMLSNQKTDPRRALASGFLNDGRCNSSSTEAGVLVAITSPEGGTYYHLWRDRIPSIILSTWDARTCVIIRRLLKRVLVVIPGGRHAQ